MQAKIQIYLKPSCPYCIRAKELLNKKGFPYQEINIENNLDLKKAMEERSHRKTVPQIFIGHHHVGGCDDLYALEAKGDLDGLLKEVMNSDNNEE